MAIQQTELSTLPVPGTYESAVAVAGQLWLLKEWSHWVAGTACALGKKAFDFADAPSNVHALLIAYKKVEQSLKEAQADEDIKTHLPEMLKRCRKNLIECVSSFWFYVKLD